MTRAIVTAAEIRAAERSCIAAGVSVDTLMARAGRAAAEAAWRFAGQMPALVLCGPGNNGGDGYVVARALRERGAAVRVAALGEPGSDAARTARAGWDGAVESLAQAAPAPLLIDALFGTGLGRPLDPATAARLHGLAAGASARVAIDLPSGVATDDGAILSDPPDYHLTISFAALKPSHLLQPAAAKMGRLVIADIGVPVASRLHLVERPLLRSPGPADHKYSRGYVLVLGGEMSGASALSATAALRAGAGYVRRVADTPSPAIPHAVVQSEGAATAHLDDERVGAVVVGPGLGRGEAARAVLGQALASGRPLVLDADALVLLDAPARLRDLPHMPILTPHGGEFARLFGAHAGGKVEQARAAAAAAGAVVVLKGSDTVIAHPDGRAAIAAPASPWLASAGTGDVLAGVIAARRAAGDDAFAAACAGVWLHARAGERAGPALIADDLLTQLPRALFECL